MEKWVIKNKKADFEQIMQECGVSEVLARCLVNKGLQTPEEIRSFLQPSLDELYNPFLLKDMDKACHILKDKIASGKRIRIIGDYDVDGVVSTYILYRTLEKLGAKVDYEIPDRIKDGYGINQMMVEAAYREGIDTLLTCDNGIVALEQVELAKSYGMTVIITDHHNLLEINDSLQGGDEAAATREADPSEQIVEAEQKSSQVCLPRADAIINPKQPDCGYPYRGLCGAAIAFKLCSALLSCYDIKDREAFEEELIAYSAIATVCDVMDLTGENRIIVKHGLRLLANTENKGLLALMEESGIQKEQLSAFHLGFIIGPCLNASGRLDTAKKGLELLLAKTKEQAGLLAKEVRELNELRKEMTAQNLEKAIELIEGSSLRYDKVLVVYLRDCHESIAGIIAGRIRERYNRPTLVLTDSENCVKGSARSIEIYNMIEELNKCRELFLKLGGHPMAAGFSLRMENVEPLRAYLNQNTSLTEEMLIPKVSIDIHLPFGYLSEALIHELKQLEPFGKGNEKPLFAEKELKIKSAFVIGKNASGIRLSLENKYGRTMEAVYFGDVDKFFTYIGNTYGEEETQKLKSGRRPNFLLAVTYFPKVNEYNGFRNLQIIIQNYR
jgi:single-stranded-DNA-specific exonuclease